MSISKQPPTTTGRIQKQSVPDPELTFSFKFFDHTDVDVCPAQFRDGYTQALMQRLRDLSSWRINAFTGKQDKAIRNHPHDWAGTQRPDGFAHLNDHFRAIPGWQFCISANERGRVHGIIIDATFYVIWLDQDHKLYAR